MSTGSLMKDGFDPDDYAQTVTKCGSVHRNLEKKINKNVIKNC